MHVLLDWVGSQKIDEAFLKDKEAAGVQVRKVHQPHWYNLARLNNRTHRKLLVVDGKIGFTSGVGIAPNWTGHARKNSRSGWRCCWTRSCQAIHRPALTAVKRVLRLASYDAFDANEKAK